MQVVFAHASASQLPECQCLSLNNGTCTFSFRDRDCRTWPGLVAARICTRASFCSCRACSVDCRSCSRRGKAAASVPKPWRNFRLGLILAISKFVQASISRAPRGTQASITGKSHFMQVLPCIVFALYFAVAAIAWFFQQQLLESNLRILL